MLLMLVHKLLLSFLRLILSLSRNLTEARCHQIEVVLILLILLERVLPVLPLKMGNKLILLAWVHALPL